MAAQPELQSRSRPYRSHRALVAPSFVAQLLLQHAGQLPRPLFVVAQPPPPLAAVLLRFRGGLVLPVPTLDVVAPALPLPHTLSRLFVVTQPLQTPA